MQAAYTSPAFLVRCNIRYGTTSNDHWEVLATEVAPPLPQTGLNSLVTDAVEMALMGIKQQAREQLRGTVELKMHRTIDDISDAIASMTQSPITRTADCH